MKSDNKKLRKDKYLLLEFYGYKPLPNGDYKKNLDPKGLRFHEIAAESIEACTPEGLVKILESWNS